MTSPVPFLQPDPPKHPGGWFFDDNEHPPGENFCGTHHEDNDHPGRCCCGGAWPGTMTCHPCRNAGHTAEDCVDGPPAEGGRYGTGRKCSCQHKPAGSAVAPGGGGHGG